MWRLGLCLTSSCCTRESYAAVPHNILRGAIGTFHTGKSASFSRGVSLHGNFLARFTTQSAHLLRVITASCPVRRSALRSFLKLSSACLINVTCQVDLQEVEVSCQSRVSRSRSRTVSSYIYGERQKFLHLSEERHWDSPETGGPPSIT